MVWRCDGPLRHFLELVFGLGGGFSFDFYRAARVNREVGTYRRAGALSKWCDLARLRLVRAMVCRRLRIIRFGGLIPRVEGRQWDGVAVGGNAVVQTFCFNALYVSVGPLVVRDYVNGGVGAFLQGFRVVQGSSLLACWLFGFLVQVSGGLLRVSCVGLVFCGGAF